MTITYMVMPYCLAGSLENWLRTQSETPLTPPEIASLIEQAAEALQYAHEHEMIHLDVKPSNFLLRTNRKKPRRPTLLLADFGIARNFTTVANSSRTIRGTPTSMAPEQWSGSPVFASDQYALAVMAYELLTGRPPFVGSLEQLMYRHFTVQAPAPSTFNPRLSAAFDPVLLRALAKQPEERFSSIADFASAFVEAAQQPATPVEMAIEEDVAEYATVAISADVPHSGVSRLLTLADDQDGMLPISEVNEDQSTNAPSEDEDATRVSLKRANQEDAEAATIERDARTEQAPITPQIEPFAESELLSEHDASAPIERDDQHELHAPVEAVVEHDLRVPIESIVGGEPVEPASEQELESLEAADMGHDLPTIVSNEPSVRVTEAPLFASVRSVSRRAGVLALVSALALLVLLIGSIFTVISRQSANGQRPGHHSAPTSTPQTKGTVTSPATPASGLYIAGTYNGSMADNALQQTKLISVVLTQTQGQGALRGTVTFNHSDQQVYPLNGTVDPQGNFSFTVQQPVGQIPFVFYGKAQPGNYLKGNYCNSGTGICQTSAGYFNVGPRE